VELLSSGREADVFPLDDRRVLRRCRDARSRCEREASTMEWVRGHGYPVPRVHSVDGPDMVLDRVDGPTMAEAMFAGTTSFADAARTLCRLHERLHAVPAPPGSDPTSSVLHLDLHPLNVLMSASGPVVIDWANSEVGSAGTDVAVTAVILGQAASVPGELAEPAAVLLDAFLGCAGPLAAEDVEAAVAYRAHNPTLSSLELTVLPDVARSLCANGATALGADQVS
jgi:tRNA A-37 threonylcarbamoyl transferase component Bud32